MPKALLDIDGPIARLTLNRPEVMNALDAEACEELLTLARRVERTPGVRCLILGGAGASFMSGADVKELASQVGDPDRDLVHEFESNVVRRANEFCQVIERLPVPVISSVRGAVSGGGLGIALSADFVVASETAFFFAAHAMVGLTPDGGLSWYLTRLVGARRAKEILMLGKRVPASEALEIGMLHSVVADDQLEAATDALAAALLAMPAASLAGIKQLVNSAPQHSFADHLQMEARLLGEAAGSPDFHEGVAAFREKRRPRFGTAS